PNHHCPNRPTPAQNHPLLARLPPYYSRHLCLYPWVSVSAFCVLEQKYSEATVKQGQSPCHQHHRRSSWSYPSNSPPPSG
ncbi:centromeric dna binding protein, partial [Moniliophthora roreri]